MKLLCVCLLTLSCGLCALGQDSLNVTRVGSLDYWDSAVKLEVAGNYAFVACQYGGLRVVDVTNPSEPVEVGSYAPGNRIDCLVSFGNYVYLGTIDGIQIINIENPSNPIPLGFLAIDPVNAIAVSGSYLYAMTFGSELHVIDAGNPLEPIEVASYDPQGSSGGGIAVQGSYAYVTAGWYGLRVVDISNPLAPQEVGSVDPLAYCGDLIVSGTGAYVAGGTDGLLLISVSNPAVPNLVGGFIAEGPVRGVAVTEDFNYVFAAAGSAGVRAIDAVPPQMMHEVGSYDTPGTSYCVVLSGTYAYVADGSGGLQILDVSNPPVPIAVGSLSHPGRAGDVSVAGNYAYVAAGIGGLQVVDFSNPQVPLIVGLCGATSVGRVEAAGSYACILGSIGLGMIDVSNPTAPLLVGSATILDDAIFEDLAVAGSYAYVAYWTDFQLPHDPYPDCELAVFDISDPAAPVLAGACTGAVGQTESIAVNGNYAYVTIWGLAGRALWTVDISNPAAPAGIDYYPMTGYLGGIAVSGSYAYVACGTVGMQVLDVSNPTSPYIISTFDTPGSATSVTLASNYAFDYAFVADASGGLRILDVTDPSEPFETGYYVLPTYATAAAVSGDFAFVAELAYLGIYDVSSAMSSHPHSGIIPTQFALYPAYPNPFNSVTTLQLDLPREVKVRLAVYDVLGRKVQTLVDGMMNAGSHSVRFDASGLTSGMYVLRMNAADISQEQKVMLIR